MTTVWLAGATGLVGGALLGQLLDDATIEVVAVGRRAAELAGGALAQRVVDFADAATFADLPAPAVALCCLGTTRRRAGSRQAFRAVDLDAVLGFARAARARGAGVFVHVSSVGADPRALAFYARVKGEAEAAVAALGFASCYALRPSILDGARAERRPFEEVGLVLARALAPVLGPYRPTPAAAVARAMRAAAHSARPGAHVVEPGAILRGEV